MHNALASLPEFSCADWLTLAQSCEDCVERSNFMFISISAIYDMRAAAWNIYLEECQ